MRAAIAILCVATTTAAASPRVAKQARDVRAVFIDARRECKQPGAKLDALVERVFSIEGFGRRVIDHWVDLTDAQRADFDVLANEFVGRAERERAIKLLCLPGRVSSAREVSDGIFFIDVVREDEDADCTHLQFVPDGKRWRFDGEWFCGKSLFWENWRRKLGGGDYAKAMSIMSDTTPPGRVVD